MPEILSKTTMLIQFPKPKLATSKRKQSYNRIVDNAGKYEQKLRDGSLTVQTQETILGAISTDCSFWLTEDKGKHPIQGKYLSELRKSAEAILAQNKNSLATKSSEDWYQHKWAWNRAVAFATKNFSQEAFEFYVAVQKWVDKMHHNRNGAWYILTNYLKTQGNVDVGLAEGAMNAQQVLGTPSTTINISGGMYKQMAAQLRRAHATMFDPAVKYMEKTTQWQHIDADPYFKAASRHVAAGVVGPL